MTERGSGAVQRDASSFVIGPSALSWRDDALLIDIDEVTAPLPSRIRGTVRVSPHASSGAVFTIDRQGRHVWRPIAPSARVEVRLDRPGSSWSGSGYLDANAGSEPLEAGFKRWDWSRAATHDGAVVLYDVTHRDGGRLSMGLAFDRSGAACPFEPPPRVRLPRTLWRIERLTQADTGERVSVCRTLEDTPFYARSILDTRVRGEDCKAFHESLDLDRFASPWVQTMLPFRMPRRSR